MSKEMGVEEVMKKYFECRAKFIKLLEKELPRLKAELKEAEEAGDEEKAKKVREVLDEIGKYVFVSHPPRAEREFKVVGNVVLYLRAENEKDALATARQVYDFSEKHKDVSVEVHYYKAEEI